MGFFTTDIKRLEKDRDIPGLMKFLGSKRASDRYRAFVALSGLENIPAESMKLLQEMTRDIDPRVKTIAALKFADKGGAVSDVLLDIMKRGTPEEKVNLLQVISGRGSSDDPAIMQAIMIGMIDKKETVRIQAVKAAGLSKSTHLVPNLGEFLHAKHHKERIFAAQALFDIGGEESTDYLIGLLADSHPEVHRAARGYLENTENEYVKKALHDASFMQLVKNMNGKEPVREKTAHMIGAELIREGLPLLHRGCRDKYKGVRIQSLKSIALFKTPSSSDIVEKLLFDRFFDVRIEALNTLEKIGGKRAMKAVEKALTDRNSYVRERAEEILGIKKE